MFKQYFVEVLRNKYADFDGRARRSEYWYFCLFNALVAFGLGIIVGLIGASWLSTVYSLAVMIPGLALGVRRMHDIGKSGWWILISLIPIVGAIWFLVLCCKAGDTGANAYGPDPKA